MMFARWTGGSTRFHYSWAKVAGLPNCERTFSPLLFEYVEANLPHERHDRDKELPRSLNPALDLQPPEAGVSAYAQGPSLWRSRPLSCSRLFPATQQCAVQTDPRRPYFGRACLGRTEQLSRY